MNDHYNTQQLLNIANMSFKGTLISLNEKLEAMVQDKSITPDAAVILSKYIVGMYNTYTEAYDVAEQGNP